MRKGTPLVIPEGVFFTNLQPDSPNSSADWNLNKS